MRLPGLILIVFATLVPVIWFAPLAGERDAVALFSQYLGSSALILMGINQFLATRVAGLETIFGSLDRIYVLHKWLGVTALVLMGLHDIIDAEMNGLRGGPLAGIAEDIGEVSLYGLLILILASAITFIPYHLWKWTHRFIGIFFAMGAFHFFFIEKPFSNFEPLGLYISVFCILGLASYVWISVVRPMAPRGHAYVVQSVKRLGSVTDVVLSPKSRGMRHKPGQFAFLSFKGSGLSEEHPFTLSDAPTGDRTLRFSIKDLGNYTHRLGKHLKVGEEATVSGPHGHFTLPSGTAPQVWVGAGIGITPFLAFAESLKNRKSGPVKLYYCVRDTGDIPYAVELEKLAESLPDLELIIVNSAEGVRLTPERVIDDLGGRLSEAHVFFCGPVAMRKALKSGLILKGLKASRFHFEEFEMRTGIGLGHLSAWIWDTGMYQFEKRQAQKAQPAE
ncbi:putative ferric reductase [Roseibium hamelinense]|uniref:Putative ferric reductase n=1 Tax=Roseibium hamelinense TaxID=150831 RepID=A0A562T7J4_9HYPH|nr:ferredoxin reductase family protein [Roseibium hamelinense]MTI42998.1 iron reductase [Roseibium hamelinense]TWI89609.1 putative ferric reductase [Roseibium hamelinense]